MYFTKMGYQSLFFAALLNNLGEEEAMSKTSPFYRNLVN